MTDWEKAKLCRILARKAKTRTDAQSLYAKARYLEKRANFETATETNETNTISLTQTGPNGSGQLPYWFREARAKLRCSKCKRYQGTWWYTKRQNGSTHYTRTRVMAQVSRGHYEAAVTMIKNSIMLCRRCANEG